MLKILFLIIIAIFFRGAEITQPEFNQPNITTDICLDTFSDRLRITVYNNEETDFYLRDYGIEGYEITVPAGESREHLMVDNSVIGIYDPISDITVIPLRQTGYEKCDIPWDYLFRWTVPQLNT